MLLIDAKNAEGYLRNTGRIASEESVNVRELSGGVSNIVLLVSDSNGEPRFVIKQVREQLRVPDPWFCSIERIWREVEVLEICHKALTASDNGSQPSDDPAVSVPTVLFCDRDNYLYAMTAAPRHEVWKSQLLRGKTDLRTASACGRLLGTIHAATWQQPHVAQALSDRSFFDALRLDPYYRHVANQHADLAPIMQALIDSLTSHPRCLVHGDFSPKNILVHADGLTLIDFEVGHFGDPGFDLGFFLSHLVLKAIRAGDQCHDYLQLTDSFWARYRERLLPTSGENEFTTLVERGIANAAGCLMARVDGKSRVDYLDAAAQETVRRLARDLLLHPASTWEQVTARFVSASAGPDRHSV
jgi:5-methylthioribose kinase